RVPSTAEARRHQRRAPRAGPTGSRRGCIPLSACRGGRSRSDPSRYRPARAAVSPYPSALRHNGATSESPAEYTTRMFHRGELSVATKGRGTYDITRDVASVVG